MFRCLIITPTGGWCRPALPFCLFHLTQYFNQNRVWPEFEEQELGFQYYEGSGISQNREKGVMKALEEGYSHILFVDDDMGFNPDALHRLAARRLPIVGCNYRMRQPPAEFMAHRDNQIIHTRAASTGIEPVDYLGFGFCLIEMDVFRNIEPPWFEIHWHQLGAYSTEDATFMRKAKRCGYTTMVDHDTSKVIWHNGNVAYVWNDDFSNINLSLRST